MPLQLSSSVRPGQSLPLIDQLKGFALLLVLWYHSGGVLGVENKLHGEVGVDVFLLVSGCVLVLSAADLDLRAFLQRRLLRIFPAYWVALALFASLHHWRGAPVTARSLGWHVFALHGLGPEAEFFSINDSFWYLTLILFLYGAFLVVRPWLRLGGVLVLAAGTLTFIATVGYQTAQHQAGLWHAAIRVPSFFLGLAAGQLLRGGSLDWRPGWALALGAVLLVYLQYARGIAYHYTIAGAAMVALWLGVHTLCQRFALGRGLLRAVGGLGIISYEVFLLHQPLIREGNRFVQIKWLGRPEPTFGQLLAGLLLALALSLLLGWGLHLACQRLFRRRTRQVAPPAPPPPDPTPLTDPPPTTALPS